MGLFTSKIFMGVVAGGAITLGGLGLTFAGTGTLDDITNFAKDSAGKIAQYEQNEESLLEKMGLLKEDAQSKLAASAAKIKDLEGQKAGLDQQVASLTEQVNGLNTEITTLEEALATEQGNHAETQAALDQKSAEYDAKVAELEEAKKKQKELEGALKLAYEKAQQGDDLVTELEQELQKANEEVEKAGQAVEAEKEKVKDVAPLSQEELDAIPTSLDAPAPEAPEAPAEEPVEEPVQDPAPEAPAEAPVQ